MDQDGTSQQPAPLLKAHLSDRNDGSCMEFSTLIRNVQNTARYAKVVPNVPFFCTKTRLEVRGSKDLSIENMRQWWLSTFVHQFAWFYNKLL